jgi:hypothetical protein
MLFHHRPQLHNLQPINSNSLLLDTHFSNEIQFSKHKRQTSSLGDFKIQSIPNSQLNSLLDSHWVQLALFGGSSTCSFLNPLKNKNDKQLSLRTAGKIISGYGDHCSVLGFATRIYRGERRRSDGEGSTIMWRSENKHLIGPSKKAMGLVLLCDLNRPSSVIQGSQMSASWRTNLE